MDWSWFGSAFCLFSDRCGIECLWKVPYLFFIWNGLDISQRTEDVGLVYLGFYSMIHHLSWSSQTAQDLWRNLILCLCTIHRRLPLLITKKHTVFKSNFTRMFCYSLRLGNPLHATSTELVSLDTQDVIESEVVAPFSVIHATDQALHATWYKYIHNRKSWQAYRPCVWYHPTAEHSHIFQPPRPDERYNNVWLRKLNMNLVIWLFLSG